MKRLELLHGHYALIDDEDFKLLSQRAWRINNGGYVISRDVQSILLHRLITDCPQNLEVDHINHDKLDNRRSNLRVCSHANNLRHSAYRHTNTTGYTGVSRRKNKWRAYVNVNGKPKHLGYYLTPESAAKARDKFVRTLYGEFATLNIKA